MSHYGVFSTCFVSTGCLVRLAVVILVNLSLGGVETI